MRESFYKITEQDILNIPNIHIFNAELDSKIYSTCKHVLEISKNREDGYRYDEMALILNRDTYDTVELAGYNGRIDTTSERYFDLVYNADYNSLLLIHSHPNNSEISYNDMVEMLMTDSIVGVIAVGNRGRISALIKESDDLRLYTKVSQSMMQARIKDRSRDVEDIAKSIQNRAYELKLRYINIGGTQL